LALGGPVEQAQAYFPVVEAGWLPSGHDADYIARGDPFDFVTRSNSVLVGDRFGDRDLQF
jgi:hypothetical protein